MLQKPPPKPQREVIQERIRYLLAFGATRKQALGIALAEARRQATEQRSTK